MSEQRISTKVLADSTEYKRGMDDAARATKDFERTLSDASKQAEQAGFDWRRAAETATGVFGGVVFERAVRNVVNFGVEMVKSASMAHARFETLGVVMNQVGQNAGYNRAEMDGYAESVRRMGITLTESRNTVISMTQAHLDLSNAAGLARVAQDAAVIGGVNSSEALRRIMYGIKSAQVEVLRTIGINVNFESSYKRLADQLGKTTNDLTETEKATARLSAVMQSGSQIAGSYEAAMDTAGKKMGSLQRYVDDARVTLGETFNEALIILVDGLTGGLQGLNEEAAELQRQDSLRQWGRAAITTGAFVLDVFGNVVGIFEQAGRAMGALAAIAANPTNAGAIWREYSADTNKWIADADRFRQAAEETFRVLDADRDRDTFVTGVMRDFSDGLIDYEAAVGRFVEAHRTGVLSAEVFQARMNELNRSWRRQRGESFGSNEGTGQDGTGKPRRTPRVDLNLGQDVDAAQIYARTMEQLNRVQVDALRGTQDLDAAQSALFDLMQNPAWERMPEPWRELVRATTEQASASLVAAERHARLSALLAATPTAALEKARDDMLLLNEAMLEGRITAEEFSEAASARLGLVPRALDDTKDAFEDLQRAIEGWGQASADAIVDFAATGKGSFSDMADSILRDLARMAVYQNITQPLTGWLSGLDWGSMLGGLFGGGRAGGGAVSRGRFYEVNEDEPELVTTRGRTYLMMGGGDGQVSHVGRGAPGAGTQVQVNVMNNAGDTARADAQARQNGDGSFSIDVLIERIEGTMGRRMGQGGGLAPLLEGRYGLSPAAGAR